MMTRIISTHIVTLATAFFSIIWMPLASAAALEEVIVTAQKREQSLQDVPISVGVLQGEFVDNMAVRGFEDLQNFIPSLIVQETFGNSAVRIRGLGSGVTNLAFDSSVSLFNDGVYCARSRCFLNPFVDLERIEVARGPQGALFGKNTIAGAVSLISARPTEELDGFIRGSYDVSDGGYEGTAMVSGPLGESFRARGVVQYKNLGGFVKNPIDDTDDGEVDQYLLRGSFEWDASDTIQVYGKVEYGEKDVKGTTVQILNVNAPLGRLLFLPADPNQETKLDDVRRVSAAQREFDDQNNFSATLQIEAEIFNEHTLTSITNYSEFDYTLWQDVDGSVVDALDTQLGEDFEQFSQELRLLSPSENKFEYVLSASYYTNDSTTRQFSPFTPAWLNVALRLAPLPVRRLIPDVPAGADRNFQQDGESFSIAGQLTWNITDRLQIIGDLRYTDETKDGVAFALPVEFLDGITPTRDTTPRTPIAHTPEYRFSQKYKDDHLDPSIKLKFDGNHDTSVYASWAKGSKAGGLKANDGQLGAILLAKTTELGAGAAAYYQEFVGQATVTPANLIAGLTLKQGNTVFDFEDETAESFEIGAKLTLADGSANLNIALFTTDFENLQVSSYDGTRFIITNAASAEIKGVEIDGQWQVTDNLLLTGSLVYLDHEYSDYMGGQCLVANATGAFVNPDCTDGEEDLSGVKIERTPDVEGNIGANWQSTLANGLIFRLGGSLYYSSSYAVRQDLHPLGIQDDFVKIDARSSIAAADDKWEIAIIGRNLTDEFTIQHAFEIARINYASVARGRYLAIETELRF